MFDLEEIENFATKKISYPLLIKGKDYDYERGRIFYKKSAIKNAAAPNTGGEIMAPSPPAAKRPPAALRS